ncbi:hypothetical protein [Croceibacterium salegens]|nr:hypothetical protein [Croceibacterium salegens]
MVKEALETWLIANGWAVEIAWGKIRGIDVLATRDSERWIIEAKGCGSSPPMRVTYFLCAMGETLQRMDESAARYSIAFPDMKQFRGLWERLPPLAKARTGVTAIFVGEGGDVEEVK